MSAPMVSAFYDFNDVIQQNKPRPALLELRQRLDRKPANLLIPRRHSASSSLTVPVAKQAAPLSPSSNNNNFYQMPPSPKEQYFGNMSPAIIRDRAQSASIQEEIEAQHRKRGSTNSSRYKTELCRPFEENGTCKYGDKCQFAHGMHELRGLNRHPKYKTEYCRTYHTIGFCPYGPRCHFIHNDEEKRLPSHSSERPNSISSVSDSTPSSPIIEMAPSPFGNSLTPPTSPGYGGEVFLFDESHVNHTPLAVCGQNIPALSPMAPIAENVYTMDYSPISPGGMMHSEPQSVPVTALEHHPFGLGIPLPAVRVEEVAYSSGSSGSDSSNPPSPTESFDGMRRGSRLSAFGFVH